MVAGEESPQHSGLVVDDGGRFIPGPAIVKILRALDQRLGALVFLLGRGG